MMKMHVTSLFPADRDTVYAKLQEIATLQYICSPLATFTPLDDSPTWQAGAVFRFDLAACGLKFGVHTIIVQEFDIDRVATNENNKNVPVWNHIITLEKCGENHTKYTDIVEVRAGWKTLFIWLWANVFYRHRQRKWRELLRTKLVDANKGGIL
jgi:hypothetical protein